MRTYNYALLFLFIQIYPTKLVKMYIYIYVYILDFETCVKIIVHTSSPHV